MSVTLVSICGRSETGISRPFFGEGDDGHSYFLKRDNISPDQLVVEYVISRLAEECGLPVAPVQIVEIPSDLTRYAIVERADEFCPGAAFGSQRIPFADELRVSHLRQVEIEVKMRVILFDWWVRNPDRQLSILGGDPNILWDPTLQSIHLVDHDRCLDPDFNEAKFMREHIFRDVRHLIGTSIFEKWRTKFESTIYNLGQIWEEIPPEWLEDESGIARTSLTQPEIEAQLIKPEVPADGILLG